LRCYFVQLRIAATVVSSITLAGTGAMKQTGGVAIPP